MQKQGKSQDSALCDPALAVDVEQAKGQHCCAQQHGTVVKDGIFIYFLLKHKSLKLL